MNILMQNAHFIFFQQKKNRKKKQFKYKYIEFEDGTNKYIFFSGK